MSKHQVGRKGAVLLRISRIFGMETTLNKLGWLHNSHLINGEQMIIWHKFYCVTSHWDCSGCVCVWVGGKNRSMWTWTIFFLGKIVRKCEFFLVVWYRPTFIEAKHTQTHTPKWLVLSRDRSINFHAFFSFSIWFVCVRMFQWNIYPLFILHLAIIQRYHQATTRSPDCCFRIFIKTRLDTHQTKQRFFRMKEEKSKGTHIFVFCTSKVKKEMK